MLVLVFHVLCVTHRRLTDTHSNRHLKLYTVGFNTRYRLRINLQYHGWGSRMKRGQRDKCFRWYSKTILFFRQSKAKCNEDWSWTFLSLVLLLPSYSPSITLNKHKNNKMDIMSASSGSFCPFQLLDYQISVFSFQYIKTAFMPSIYRMRMK